MQATRTCTIDGCERPARRRGWCGAHHQRFLRHGDPLGGGPDRAAAPPVCVVEGCDKAPVGRGLCNSHWKADRLADSEYRERKNAAWRAWAETHADQRAAYQRQYREDNAASIAERMAWWRAQNPGASAVSGWTRRRRAYGLPEDIVEVVDPAVVFDRDEGVCQLCGRLVDPGIPWPEPWSPTLDHTIPVCDPTSTHSYSNTVLAHWDCNRRKRAALRTEVA